MSNKTGKYPGYTEAVNNQEQFTSTQEILDPNGKPTGQYKPADNYRVEDVNGKEVLQYNTTPKTTTDPSKSNTGSGLEAALGTSYSWNDNATERAGLNYQSDVLKAKAEYLTNRQQIESQGQASQEQISMQKYIDNQSADKVGWTGGYILDQERQMNYLKETIKAQMYGQMELQKYGYDTSLAAARLAYDTNRYDLALEYYNTALSRAVSEAEITGYYVAPEVREMLDEYSLASKVLNTEGLSEEEKLRADKVLTSVYKWFEDNGISKNGVETMAHQDFILTLKAAAEARLQYSNESIYGLVGGGFAKVDSQGNILYTDNNASVQTFDFGSMTASDILAYGTSGSNIAKEQVHAYIDNLINKEVQSYLKSISTIQKNSDGSTISKLGNINSADLEKVINESAQKVFTELQSAVGDNEAYKKLLSSYDYNSPIDELDMKITVNDKGKFQYSYNGQAVGQPLTTPTTNLSDRLNTAMNSKDDAVSFADLANTYNDVFKDYSLDVQSNAIHGNKSDDDFDIDIGNKNYDLDVDWEAGKWYQVNSNGKSQDDFDKTVKELKSKFPNQSQNNLVIYNGELWFYSSKVGKWGYVQMNNGGSKLYEDLQTAMKGDVPGRWK